MGCVGGVGVGVGCWGLGLGFGVWGLGFGGWGEGWGLGFGGVGVGGKVGLGGEEWKPKCMYVNQNIRSLGISTGLLALNTAKRPLGYI